MLNTDDGVIIIMRVKEESIDIYTNDDQDINAMLGSHNKGLIIFTEHEYGCATHIAVGGMVDLKKPDGKILTHLINNNVFNQTEDFEEIGWDIYFQNGYTILNITRWPQTSLIPPEQSMSTWINVYPPVRDFLSLAHRNGHNSVFFLSSTTIHDALDNDIFKIHDSKEIIEYNFHQTITDEVNLFFSPPTWLFPYIGKLMGYEVCMAIMVGNNPDERLDWEAGVALQEYLYNTFALPIIEGASLDIKHDLEELFDRSDKLMKDIDGIVNKPTSPPSHLWG